MKNKNKFIHLKRIKDCVMLLNCYQFVHKIIYRDTRHTDIFENRDLIFLSHRPSFCPSPLIRPRLSSALHHLLKTFYFQSHPVSYKPSLWSTLSVYHRRHQAQFPRASSQASASIRSIHYSHVWRWISGAGLRPAYSTGACRRCPRKVLHEVRFPRVRRGSVVVDEVMTCGEATPEVWPD